MDRLREWLARLWATFRPSRPDADLEEELRLHLEMAAEHHAANGRGDGVRAAAIRSGGLAQSMEHLRDQRGLPWLDALGQDARDAWRSICRAPGFCLVAILTLAAGLALCLVVLIVANAFLLRPLPYPEAARLHSVVLAPPGQSPPSNLAALDWASLDAVFDNRIAWDLDMFFLLGGRYPEPAPGAWVTPGFVRALGVRAERGRSLEAPDFRPGTPIPVMISHRLWRTRFSGHPDIIGRSFKAYVSDRPDQPETLTIVGVLPERFWHFNAYTEVLAPLRASAYPYLVTVRDGIDPVLATERLTALVRTDNPSLPGDWHAMLVPFQSRYTQEMRPLLQAVGVSAALVLLIACANVAVLLLVRSVRRRHEIAIRIALGASRARIARLLTMEASVLAVTATSMGVGASALLALTLAPIVEQRLGRRIPGGESALAIDGTVALAALAGAILLTAALTLAPLVVTVWSPGFVRAIRSAGRGSTDGRFARRVRSALVVAEIAAAMALLVASALVIESALGMLRVDPGLRPEGVTIANVGVRPRSYPDAASRAEFFGRLLQRLQAGSGDGSAALSDASPLQPPQPRRLQTESHPPRMADAGVTRVTADYFAALGIGFCDGGPFTAEDRVGGEPVAVVSESLARTLWPGLRAVGQMLRIAGDELHGSGSVGTAHRVVGVVNDLRLVSYDDGRVGEEASRLQVYVPLLQDANRFAFVYARHRAAPPEDLRLVVSEIDPTASVLSARSLQAMYDETRSGLRHMAWLLSGFAAFAAALALLGVYSVMAYGVRQREREIGVRLVVGADPTSLVRSFVLEGSRVLVAGLAAGLAGAAVLGRVLRTQLFEVEPLEPGLISAVAALFATCGLLALWWPARRASQVDPSRVLRDE